jgi:hypothetical protein
LIFVFATTTAKNNKIQIMANWDIHSNQFFKISISDLANGIINSVYETNRYVELRKKIVVCNIILGMQYLTFLSSL